MTGVPGSDLLESLASAVARMPDPAGGGEVEALEAELATWAGVPHAVAVCSGTAALHTALVAAGIGAGDEVLVPAVSVVMSVAPILYAAAAPVFVDCVPGGFELDYDDLAGKVSTRTRAVLPVHLWGRACGDPHRLREFAAARDLVVIEDACQAHGTRIGDQLLGTLGDVGCFSLKDGKILWSGEGGFLLTRDAGIAARARAFRTHWQTPPDGERPMTRLGHNYRLAEPLAAIARWNLARIDELLEHRRAQTLLLIGHLDGIAGLRPVPPRPGEDWNGYAPLFRLDLPNPREFSRTLWALGVPNSIGTFHLIAANLRPVFAPAAHCPTAETFIDMMLAVTVAQRDDDASIRTFAEIITREASRWTST